MKLYPANVHPTPILLFPDKLNIEKAKSPAPANVTNTDNFLVLNLRINSIYNMFPMYSKNKDQKGPFNGNISPFPLISVKLPGLEGIKKKGRRAATTTDKIETSEPSHFSHPCMQKVITPSIVPIMTIGWRRINLFFMKSLFFILFHLSS